MRCCNEAQALPPMQLTAGPLTSDICRGCHPLQVHTMDVQTQGEGPRWTLHQVRAAYWS